MNRELELKLIEKYPDFFNYYRRYPKKVRIRFTFSCGNGWYNLIDNLCYNLSEKIKDKNFKIIVIEVKQKFGGLRFYYIIEHERTDFLFRIGAVIRKFMFNKRLGKKYWKIIDFRRKFWKTIYEKISDEIEKAEKKSYEICESCGKKGTIIGRHYIRISCEECKNNTKR
ncbi:MAG: hypothetical protein ACFFG0_00675 [Candidatus Thorarchaeota archaeon]